MVAPVIDTLAERHQGKVVFAKVNTDENPLFASENEIYSIPTMPIFKDGKLADRIVGALPIAQLEPRITRFF